jgi:tetratricopeptide (TPR) repeat protein
MMGVRRWFVAFMVALVAVPALHAQKTLRDSALALMDAHKTVDALPLLEALVRRDSTDRLVTEHLAFVLFEGSAALPDAPARKAQRLRARSLFAKAVALGSTSQQVVAVLNAIPPDGGEDFTFSGNAEVNAAMSQAEASFASGEYRKALGLYQRALALDATLYDAAMFSGDAYLHLELIDSAYVWYERATRINPDRETAWRYWSDVLLKHGQPDAARDKAIEAAVADPYTRLSREGLIAWGRNTRTPLGFPRIILPARDTATVHSPAWTAYDSVRRAWQGSGGQRSAPFAAAYPRDSVYRHSVAEEGAALRAAYRAGNGDSATINLKRLDDAGLLEAYIFMVRPDAGIVADYPGYLHSHRDDLKRFWLTFVIGAPYSR